MLSDIQAHRIPVYVSDNSEDRSTEDVISRLKLEYPFVYYRRNSPPLGFEGNVQAALDMPDTDYVWLMGDSTYCIAGHMEAVLKDLDTDPDFLFVNSYSGDLAGREVRDPRAFLLDLTWYITLLGATVYSRGSRALASQCTDAPKRWRNFVHLGMILKFCASADPRMRWRGTPSLGIQRGKKSYWAESAIRVFAGDWCHLIESFPDLYSESQMDQVIKSHALHTGLFGVRHLLSLRAKGGLSFALLRGYEREFRRACPGGLWLARVISAIPSGGLNLLRRLTIRVVAVLWRESSRRACRLYERLKA